MVSGPVVHPSAIVDPGSAIGKGTRVWHWVHVCSGAIIGGNCVLGQGVYVGPGAIIGDNVKIQNNVSVFDGVILEDDVFCGPSMVFTNVINPRSFVDRKQEFRTTRVMRGASLGANCTIVCGVTIGQFAMVGAGAVVTRDVGDFELVIGVPARRVGWVSRIGERLDLSVDEESTVVCPITGESYRLENGRVSQETR
ncbi:MAG: UDP-2-acetamido-3-amino-2,3-dideoxy-D-glucuronate N-acetyltransferase [Pseudomonadales bacterium]|nr:UDP-2-acetamido-3-amino-2,3-dideoxy-D-glucuronate N-acetyltransferase [Pseudomonadales bacterium]